MLINVPNCWNAKKCARNWVRCLRRVLQDAVKRVERAYDDFFRRVEEGQKPGFPRFKSRFRYDSLTFKQYKNSFNVFESAKKNKGTLVLAKLGHVKMVMHRPIKGTPK